MALLMALTQADRSQWAHNPVTEEFLTSLKASKQEAMEAWAKEAFIGSDMAATAQMNATAIGGIRVLDQLIEVIIEYRESPDEDIERALK